MINIHATCVSYKNKGILFLGRPGSGKSDMALRMIMQREAKLVSDDRTDIEATASGHLVASAPSNIAGMLEVRGIGIKKLPFVGKQMVHLVIDLAECPEDVERMPLAEFYELEGVQTPMIKLYPFEPSVLDKIELFLFF